MNIIKLVSLFRVCIFIMLTVVVGQVHAECGCYSYDARSTTYFYQENTVFHVYTNDPYMNQAEDEDSFDLDLRTADDVFSDLEIN